MSDRSVNVTGTVRTLQSGDLFELSVSVDDSVDAGVTFDIGLNFPVRPGPVDPRELKREALERLAAYIESQVCPLIQQQVDEHSVNYQRN